MPLLSVSDLFLLPSAQESFGLAALEAMACGVPVVASRVGGLPEVVEDGVCGFLRDPDDVEGMARAAVALFSDPVLHKRFAQAGLDRVRHQFCAGRVVPQYEAYYQEVIQGVRQIIPDLAIFRSSNLPIHVRSRSPPRSFDFVISFHAARSPGSTPFAPRGLWCDSAEAASSLSGVFPPRWTRSWNITVRQMMSMRSSVRRGYSAVTPSAGDDGTVFALDGHQRRAPAVAVPHGAQPRPLQEKMALFWHQHFATAYSKIANAVGARRHADDGGESV